MKRNSQSRFKSKIRLGRLDNTLKESKKETEIKETRLKNLMKEVALLIPKDHFDLVETIEFADVKFPVRVPPNIIQFPFEWETKKKADIIEATLHEIGHMVHERILTEKEFTEWYNLAWNEKYNMSISPLVIDISYPMYDRNDKVREVFAGMYAIYFYNIPIERDQEFFETFIEMDKRNQVIEFFDRIFKNERKKNGNIQSWINKILSLKKWKEVKEEDEPDIFDELEDIIGKRKIVELADITDLLSEKERQDLKNMTEKSIEFWNTLDWHLKEETKKEGRTTYVTWIDYPNGIIQIVRIL